MVKIKKSLFKLSLSAQVFIGLLLGLFTGLFFGEMAQNLDIVGRAFIQLLQMTVLPYITVSLISGLGRLTYDDAKSLALKGGLVLLTLWFFVFVVILIFPFAFPKWTSASFFSTTLIEKSAPFDFLSLYIPSNPFASLANNIVPAVVLFSIVIGIALMGMKDKSKLLDPLQVLGATLMKVAQVVAQLAPIGVFALTSSAVGTIAFDDFGRLEVYVVTQAMFACLLTFWIIPGLVSHLTPLQYKDIVGRTRDAIITAFATGNLLIILPILSSESKEILVQKGMRSDEASASVDILVPTSFNFPSLGTLLTLAFVPYAAWFVGATMSLSQYPQYLITGLFSFFAKPAVALPFLLDMKRLPSDMFQLFLAVDVVSGRFGTMLAAMHVLGLTLLSTCAMRGKLQFRIRHIVRYLVITVALLIVCTMGARFFFTSTVKHEYTKDKFVENRSQFSAPPSSTLYLVRAPMPAPVYASSSIQKIKERGILRVGYSPVRLPFSYINSAGDLVGMDVDMAYALAKDLGVEIEFVPVVRETLAKDLRSDYCDIVMAGLYVLTNWAQELRYSQTYMKETFAFLVRDFQQEAFSSWASVQNMKQPRFGVIDDPFVMSKIEEAFPHAEIIGINSYKEAMELGAEGLDAIVMTAEEGSAWSLLYPEFSIAIPRPVIHSIPLAYAMSPNDDDFVNFVNTWIGLKKESNFIDQLYEYWILGKQTTHRKPRWSIIRDVLHWVE